MQPLKALIVEDDVNDADLLARKLRNAGYDLQWTRVDTEPEFVASLQVPLDIIFSDFSMPRFGGLRALEVLKSSGLDVPLILISGTIGEEVAVEAMRFGATDYLLKDHTIRLPTAVKRALDYTRLRETQRRTQEALRSSNQRLRSLIEHTMDCIMVLTASGVASEMNQAGLAMMQADSLAGMQKSPFLEFVFPKYRQAFHDLHQRALEGQSALLEVEVNGLTGGSRWLEVHASPLHDATQRIESVICIARDVTTRKEVDRIKSEFIATVSHELRTPLTSIRGTLGLMAGGGGGPLSDAAARLVEIAFRNTGRLSVVINDLLDFERIDAGKMSLDLATHELAPLVKQSVEECLGFAQSCQVSLMVRTPLPTVMVRVDANRILQVLANLLSNAAKFSSAGAEIGIGMAVDGAIVRVSVVDHGTGVSPAFRHRIFDRFAQADSSDTRSKGGIGLGLTIAKSLIEQMGGTIGYTTEAGLGATFFFDLPVE